MPRHQQVLRQWQILRRVEHAPQGVCIADLAAEQRLSERNLYRDLQALQEAGFPLYNDKGRWYLTEAFRRGNSIPLSQSEILALRCARSALSALAETPLFRALEGVIAKLDQALTPKLATFARQMDEAFIGDPFGLPGYDEQAEPLEPLRRAIAETRTVTLCYRAQDGSETERAVDPYHLWLQRGVLYLVGYCHLRGQIRTFSLARVQKLSLTNRPFAVQPDYDFESFRRQRFRIWAEGAPQPVSLWFAPEAATYVAERTWHPSQRIEPQPGGAIVLQLETSGLTELTTWILSFGPRARVLAPPELAERVQAELQGALEGYAPASGKQAAKEKSKTSSDPG